MKKSNEKKFSKPADNPAASRKLFGRARLRLHQRVIAPPRDGRSGLTPQHQAGQLDAVAGPVRAQQQSVHRLPHIAGLVARWCCC